MPHCRFQVLCRVLLGFCLLLFALPGQPQGRNLNVVQAGGDKRVALVIGNSAYKNGRLDNPRNDATAMRAVFQRLGFEVEFQLDANLSAMDDALTRFGRKAKSAEVALMFYAGHGMQKDGENYLVPIDAEPKKERDFDRQMVKLNDVINEMGSAKVKLVFFDACRDNPLARSFNRGGARGMAAPKEDTSGTLISFATKHGTTASDGEGEHSPYTQSLLAEIEKPGVDVEHMLKQVQQGVRKATRNQKEPQVPWTYGSLDGDFYFIFQGSTTVEVKPAGPDPAQVELTFWDSIKSSSDKADFEEYLRQYPQGRFAGIARNRIRHLTAAATVPMAPPAPSPAPTAAKPAAGLRDGQVFKDCADCPEMVVIPAGRFMMGSPDGEAGRFGDEGPQHQVAINRFALARTEVTVGQFRQFVRDTGYKTDAEGNRDGRRGCYSLLNGSWGWQAGRSWQDAGFAQGDDHPAVCLSWNDAQAYVQWLARKTQKTYRLPSEAEWEYAARGGSQTARPWGDDPDQACRFANVEDETAKRQVPGASSWPIHNCNDGVAYTAPVAHYLANGFGLYDMIGNAWEWVEDCYHSSYSVAPADGSAWVSGDCSVGRVLRGGSWFSFPRGARSAKRDRDEAAIRVNITGFRPARMLP